MGRVVLVTGVARYLGGRLAQVLQDDPSVERVIGVDVVPPADDLGAVPLREALRELGRRARLTVARAGRAAPPGSAGRGPLAGLTSREVEVLRLLAVGLSNREIAAALFIAPKTASVHVSNILAKLGASTRTEAAAIAHSNGLEPASTGLPAS